METIYRDPRFPDLEIRNHGRCTFNIWQKGRIKPGYFEDGWTNIDCFTVYQNNGYTVSPDFATKQAQKHFDEMMGVIGNDE
jgi:hypothetical protein